MTNLPQLRPSHPPIPSSVYPYSQQLTVNRKVSIKTIFLHLYTSQGNNLNKSTRCRSNRTMHRKYGVGVMSFYTRIKTNTQNWNKIVWTRYKFSVNSFVIDASFSLPWPTNWAPPPTPPHSTPPNPNPPSKHYFSSIYIIRASRRQVKYSFDEVELQREKTTKNR